MSSQAASNPWFKNSSAIGKQSQQSIPMPCSLEDVMSEQLAQELEKRETSKQAQPSPQPSYGQVLLAPPCGAEGACALTDAELAAKLALEEETAFAMASAEETKGDLELAMKLAAEGGDLHNDELIARYLQRDFDKEYNSAIDMKEKCYNGSSKVSISFENYKRRNQPVDQGEDDDEDSYDEDFPEFPSHTSWDKPKPVIGAKGYCGQGKNIVTKHDRTICGRRNAERLMEFPPEFESGDGEGMDLQLPNKVYNYLKAHSISDNKKGHKVHEKKDHSTAIKAVDERTRIMMFKLVNSGFLTSIDGVINEGKEAVVFKANGGMKDDKEIPKDVILKVYKTTLNEFKNRASYVYGDHRLAKDIFKKQNPRKIMRIWAEKEYLNLKRMRRFNLPCPSVLSWKKHILAMTCIGGEHPAPKLKDARLSTEHMQDAYEQTIQIMKRMYHDCGLIHADLSEYNLLWHDEKVWVIDVSQAMEKTKPNSNVILLRDCQNVCDFFRNSGVHDVSTAEELFMDITNYSMDGEGKLFEAQVQRYTKDDYAFDFFFELAEAARLQDLNNDEGVSSGSEEEEEEKEERSGSSSRKGLVVEDQEGLEGKNTEGSEVCSESRSWVVDSS